MQKKHMTIDIYEIDYNFIRHVSKSSKMIAQRMNFKIIDCMTSDGELRKIEDIYEEIYGEVKKLILK